MSTKEDFRTQITIIEPEIPTPSRGGVLCVGALPLTTGDTEIRTIASSDDLVLYIAVSELPEIPFDTTAFVFVPMEAETYEAQIEASKGLGKTFLFTKAVSVLLNYTSFEWDGGGLVFTNDFASAWDEANLVSLALEKNVCVFIDHEKEGKPFYTFAQTISTFPIIGDFIGKKNPDFTSIFKTTVQQNLLMSNNFSFWFQPTEGSAEAECNDVYFGGKQAQVFYEYLAVEEAVSSAVYNFTLANYPYTDSSIAILDNSVCHQLKSLVENDIIASFETVVPTVAQQLDSNKVKGIVYGYTIDFNELYRIARVVITIEGRI